MKARKKKKYQKKSIAKPQQTIALEKAVAHTDAIPATKPVEVVKGIHPIGYGTPMRYNRNFFQMSSDNLREASLNYYIATDIMNEVRNIKGYPNYKKLKVELLSGTFKKEKEPVQPIILPAEKVAPFKYLIKGENLPETKPDMVVNGDHYFLTEWDGTISGDWMVLYYLYRVYEFDGFGDLIIDGQPYRVMFHEVQGKKADLFVAQQEDRLIIGKDGGS